MNVEKYWLSQREAFLSRAREAKDDNELLDQYRMLLEQMKLKAMSMFPHDDVLRQQTALLFYEAAQGAEILLVRGKPVVVQDNKVHTATKLPKALVFLKNPMITWAILGAGLVFSLLAGKGAWRCAIFMALGLVASVLGSMGLNSSASGAVPIAVSNLQMEYLDGFITRQARLLDQHISDLQLLFQDTVAPVSDVSLDPVTLSLCQYVWAFANSNYPAESAMFTAEKLLKQNDIAWTEYKGELRGYFNVMPTQKDSRTVYPALYKISDGTLVCKGQYIEQKTK